MTEEIRPTIYEDGYADGGRDMVSRIQASLRSTQYDNGELITFEGGDVSIMNEVKRLCLDAIRYCTR